PPRPLGPRVGAHRPGNSRSGRRRSRGHGSRSELHHASVHSRRVGQPTRISFLLTNSSAPYFPSSRPQPDRLTPPNGSSAPSAPTMLTYTMPASISLATRSACSGSVVKRYEPSPNGVSFASFTASASEPTL